MKSMESRMRALEKAVFGKNKVVAKEGKFELAGLEWIVLDKIGDVVICLADKLPDGKQFDSDYNDWTGSDLRSYLNTEFYHVLADEIGQENIIESIRSLKSLDGQTEYGNCKDKVSLISFDECREYREKIPNADYWWWTLTPWSTKRNDDTTWLAVVSPSGLIHYRLCVSNYGVRPFVFFHSSIFESEGE